MCMLDDVEEEGRRYEAERRHEREDPDGECESCVERRAELEAEESTEEATQEGGQ